MREIEADMKGRDEGGAIYRWGVTGNSRTRATHPVSSVVLVLAFAAASAARGQLPIRTSQLPPPEDTAEAFEPHVAIDPGEPDRLAVAAMYGEPFARGATRTWIWRTETGGRMWRGERAIATRFDGGEPAFVADVVLGFAPDGALLFTSMAERYFLPRTREPGVWPGGIYLMRSPRGAGFVPGIQIAANELDPVRRVRTTLDKPWMTLDQAGTVYVAWSQPAIRVTSGGMSVDHAISYARSLDGGRTFLAPGRLADSAYSIQLAADRRGALHAVYLRPEGLAGAGTALFGRVSRDRGQSFGPEERIAAPAGGNRLEAPTLAASPSGTLLVCWSEGPPDVDSVNALRCAARDRGGWGPPSEVATRPAEALAWPAVAWARSRWYLLAYATDPAETKVLLFQSVGGGDFRPVATVGRRGFGRDRVCLRAATRCRRESTTSFVPGDYVSLAAAGNRLAAAYVLPAHDTIPAGSARIYLSVADLP